MSDPLVVGRRLEIDRHTAPEMSADRMGNPGIEVLATPAVVGMLDVLAHELIVPTLSAGQGTVGSKIDIAHLNATPMGMKIRARAEVSAIDGRRVTVKVDLWDEEELVASGIIERVIIDVPRFLAKVHAKAARAHRA
jgi:fluoroacetyl-CoA thioesterase